MNAAIKKIISLPRFLQRKYQNRRNSIRLERITDEVMRRAPASPTGPRILIGPTFPIQHAQKMHDILLIAALAARGAEVSYVSAPFGLPVCKECPNIIQSLKPDAAYCTFCQRFQRNSGNFVDYLKKISRIFSPRDLLTKDDLTAWTAQVNHLTEDECRTFSREGIPLGRYALDALRNLGYVGDETLIPNYKETYRTLILIQIIYFYYFSRALDAFRPDIIVCHDAFYSPWRILYDLALQRRIPFYNYYPGFRDSTYHYDRNKISMMLEVDDLYDKWKNKKIKAQELARLGPILDERKRGKIYKGWRVWEERAEERKRFETLVNNGKPTAALYGNVLWDLAALNREVVFASVQETFVKTVKFFVEHPQYNLIVKPHPDELHPTHESREKLADLITKSFPRLPENILILYPKSSITTYDLIPCTRVSLIYTTTVGIESAMLGTPVILLGSVTYRGKGFTFDPTTPAAYFSLLTELLDAPDRAAVAVQKKLACTYYYLFYFVYFHDYGIVKFDLHGKAAVMPHHLKDLLAKKDFMKIIDAIIQNQPIPYFDEGIEQI